MKSARITGEMLFRVLDAAAAFTMLVLLAPLLLLLSFAILVVDGRPILFRQQRIGRHGRPFLIYKFRTMRRAKSRNPAITVANDQRITATGAWLRRFKLDELPQLYNVLRGDMGLIGPRPEVPEYVQLDDTLWRAVLRSRPGITDLASLAYRDEENLLLPAADPEAYYRTVILPAKLRLSVAYQESRSLRRDVRLLCLTMRYCLFPGGFDPKKVLRALAE